ncbi:MAG: glycosyltransferase, partial [Deltaproteobacteria bacterium]
MNILMVTNTFTPHVGGVAKSVRGFTDELRRGGHRVLVVAPVFEGAPEREEDVIRVPAVQNFNGSDFSVPMPITGRITAALKTFSPEIVHSHHPFLLGDTALRVAASRDVPAVFTHHTMYEKYTHYVPGDSPKLKRFVVDLATGYCNLCDAVVAPSETVAELLSRRGVSVRVEVIPTGVDLRVFESADGGEYRRRSGIPEEAFVVGHVGRLAPEKNVEFLAATVASFLSRNAKARFLLVGEGPSKGAMLKTFDAGGLSGRLHAAGVLERRELACAYKAMDVFAFASLTETQGMVLAESMAAGVPVVAVDAPGVREVVRDGENGRLLPRAEGRPFLEALQWIAEREPGERRRLAEGAARTASGVSMPRTASKLLALYESLIGTRREPKAIEASPWISARKLIEEEWKILRNIARAAGEAVLPGSAE